MGADQVVVRLDRFLNRRSAKALAEREAVPRLELECPRHLHE
jgi:hypothetical protein